MRCYHVGKEDFGSKSEAERVARRMRERGRKVHGYKCDGCGGWFIGSSLSGGNAPWGKQSKRHLTRRRK